MISSYMLSHKPLLTKKQGREVHVFVYKEFYYDLDISHNESNLLKMFPLADPRGLVITFHIWILLNVSEGILY